MPRQKIPFDDLNLIDFTKFKPTILWLDFKPQKKITLCKCPICGKTGQKTSGGYIDHVLEIQSNHLGRSSYKPTQRCEPFRKKNHALGERHD